MVKYRFTSLSNARLRAVRRIEARPRGDSTAWYIIGAVALFTAFAALSFGMAMLFSAPEFVRTIPLIGG